MSVRSLALCAVMALALFVVGFDAAAQGKRPNILIIIADDFGFSDLGCYGSEIATPNVDALAKDGLRFTQFYNTGRCCPTRASLLTGLYAHQAGVGHMVEDKGHPSYRGRLNTQCVTIAEALQPAGYTTLHVGKWHVGNDHPAWPSDRGFERSYALVSGGSNYFKLDKTRVFAEDGKEYPQFPAMPTGRPGETDPKTPWYSTDAFSNKAVEYVEQYGRGGKPFFMYLAYTAPHWPLQAPESDIAKYRGKYKEVGWDKLREQRLARMIELGILPKGTPLTPRAPRAKAWESLPDAEKDQFDLKMAVYAAQIECMDRGIGRVVAKLKETGAFENTLVLFLADNGGCAEEINRPEDPSAPIGTAGSFHSYGLPWANASNTPFRLFKHYVHEGGIASPLVVHWPGRAKGEGIVNEPAHVIDLMPTCVEVAGATYPQERDGKRILPMEGASLVPVIEGKGTKLHETLYWEHEGNKAIRKGDWKLVARHGQGWELYDLSQDRVEMNNLASQEPERVKELARLYDAWTRRAEVMDWDRLNRQQQQRQQRQQGQRRQAQQQP